MKTVFPKVKPNTKPGSCSKCVTGKHEKCMKRNCDCIKCFPFGVKNIDIKNDDY